MFISQQLGQAWPLVGAEGGELPPLVGRQGLA
jgi:hypothetical protein